MVNSITKEQGLQITSLSNAGKSPRSIATELGIPLTAVNQHCSTKGRSPSLTALSNRSVSKTKASPHAIPTKTSDTKYTVIEFKPDPDGPFVNATMTEQYQGLELSYRR